MNTIHCGVVHGEAIRKIQEIKDAISVLASDGDDYDFVRSILECEKDAIWDKCVANSIHEYPVEAYKAFVNSEIASRKEDA